MTTNRGGSAPATTSSSQPSSIQEEEIHTECCMCGDLGLSSELFRCKICHFRSQHRYCSNTYPKAESYSVCNWCLNKKEETGEKAQNSINSSSSNKSSTSKSDQDDHMITRIKKKSVNSNIGARDGNNSKNSEKGSLNKVNVTNHSIKKQKSSSPERSPALLAARKRITTATGTAAAGGGGGGTMKENLRRTKSDIPGSVIYKHVFKNKVRRYKLLDEVSS
ncbi:OLC1v1017274C1 [Oldenlandia corymbosa var. corymbosa]|uniref:OLC1v1017274C1 n=1 Tax=Oldenlandia corymbosa var. corymbosa TaxID=529605 RepID=A0AAV1E947_OLDCO|nr:OLC1v1017274C1 [Oldenlandia corymbosa var. corymbosa]